MRTAIVIGALVAILIVAIVVAVKTWLAVEGTELSTAGIVAMIAGSAVSLLLGGGLMFLVFYSSRKGYDDQDR